MMAMVVAIMDMMMMMLLLMMFMMMIMTTTTRRRRRRRKMGRGLEWGGGRGDVDGVRWRRKGAEGKCM
ncbi:hypothetical protein DPMN_057149 [Dreissena polymorpha]|uniref:Uncharacterized protein n=1 Tax=Dreissena polymorpha TaxID=45954 RepID=A0A9D4HVR9_DREPO|nr:hypothetical protein DPMN_057149 [Dreissena polymorpha]